jgi:hypothetical protein
MRKSSKRRPDAKRPLRRIHTVHEVIHALGGLDAVRKMTSSSVKSVYHWTGHVEMFPARWHDTMTKALKRRGFIAPAALWNQHPEQGKAA